MIVQAIDLTSDATTTRDLNALCKNVNDFIKNPSVKVNTTELTAPYVAVGADLFLVAKIDYTMKSTGG